MFPCPGGRGQVGVVKLITGVVKWTRTGIIWVVKWFRTRMQRVVKDDWGSQVV